MSGVDHAGVHIFTLDSGDMDVTTAEYPDGTGEQYSVKAMCLRASFGKRITNRLYLNTKINLNDNSFNEYEMSYRLNSNTSIVAKIDDNKYWKLNYRFKYKY